MKKIFLILLCLIATTVVAAPPGHYGPYDPGAARSNLSNVDAAATPSMTSITLSGKVKAAWADILGDIYASGTAKVATGTAAAPAYSFSSDPDTGIYSAGADTIGFGEGGAESMRITSGGNVLIGTSTDAGGDYQLQIAKDAIMRSLVASGTSYLWANSNSTYGVNILGSNNLNPTKVFLAGKTGFSNGFTVDFTGSAMQYQFASGNVLIATSTDDGANKLQVNGFTKLGEAATGIKMKVLTGTTAAAEGGDALVAHGVTGSKIVSWSAQVDISGDVVPPEYSRSAGLKFYTYFDGTNVYIINHATESENILSKPFTAVIWYKE